MKELKDKTIQDLTKMISEKKEVLRNFRFESVGGKSKNVKLGKNTKKKIAQIMTEINIRKNGK